MNYVDARKIMVEDTTLDIIKHVLSTLPIGKAYEIQELPIDRKLLTRWHNAVRYYSKTDNMTFSIVKDATSYWIIRKA